MTAEAHKNTIRFQIVMQLAGCVFLHRNCRSLVFGYILAIGQIQPLIKDLLCPILCPGSGNCMDRLLENVNASVQTLEMQTTIRKDTSDCASSLESTNMKLDLGYGKTDATIHISTFLFGNIARRSI